ncbi:glycerate kinase [Chakrabartyella piscis]|uniref:glycerate kinase family protein n=1 Tax=Chakrabartyella piscis TaxID=2918914 RepID=UPI002958A33F|nr:glycerate kinase [Chakrabartyella piscis]
MKILLAPDSFKGSLSANEICTIARKAILDIFPNAEIISLPMADGGEGTVESILDAFHGERISVLVKNPLGETITSQFGIFRSNNAIMEMASASGLPLIPSHQRDIFHSNTYGTGQVIVSAMEKGATTIYMGIGGSGTNDCGLGCLSALGVKFLDAQQQEVAPFPANFMEIQDFDVTGLHPKLKEVNFIIMSDVQNPLLGENGATYVYGTQKGATSEDLNTLEEGMAHFIGVVEQKLGISIAKLSGAGAAGGLGAGLMAFTNAKIQSGVETILDILQFQTHLMGADLVITGEGRMDYQSAFGKVAFGVGAACKKANIPCVAIVGGLGKGYEDMYQHGINGIITTTDKLMDIDEAIATAPTLCYSAVYRLLQCISIGQSLAK